MAAVGGRYRHDQALGFVCLLHLMGMVKGHCDCRSQEDNRE